MTRPGDSPLVSVIMIFHNAERFLNEAVRSVLGQTFGDIELLLIDDGSTDGSTGAAGKFAGEFPGLVHVFEHPEHANRGMSASRNLGMVSARGELIAFLDSDDVWEPNHLAEQVHLLRSHPAVGMVCGRAMNWRSWDGGGGQDD